MIVQHFIGNNGFEACIEKKGNKYTTGWKSHRGTDFIKSERTSDLIRAIRKFNKLVNNHSKVNFK